MDHDLEQKINDQESFGIDKIMLKKLSYNTLEEIFYGVHNFDVPKLYQYMNPTEILGLHAGINKKYDDYNTLLEKVSLDIVLSKSVGFGYNISKHYRNKHEQALYELSHYLENKNKNLFPIKPGSLNSRMQSLGMRLKKRIINELKKPRDTEISNPNSDGHSKSAFIDYLIHYYENAYLSIDDQ